MVISLLQASASKLRLAGALQAIDVVEGLADGLADRKQAVVAQDHHLAVAEVLDQPLPLVEFDRHALEVVIGDLAPAHRRLRQRQQPALEHRHRHAGVGVGVQHAGDVVARAVDRAVDHVARQVDAVVRIGVGDDLAVEIDLDQRGRGDLLVHHAERIDQEMLLVARHARRDVVEVQVGHPVEIDEPIAGGEIDAGLPFRADRCRWPAARSRCRSSGSRSSQISSGSIRLDFSLGDDAGATSSRRSRTSSAGLPACRCAAP